MKPKSILDPKFVYTNSVRTDIRKRIEQVRLELAEKLRAAAALRPDVREFKHG